MESSYTSRFSGTWHVSQPQTSCVRWESQLAWLWQTILASLTTTKWVSLVRPLLIKTKSLAWPFATIRLLQQINLSSASVPCCIQIHMESERSESLTMLGLSAKICTTTASLLMSKASANSKSDKIWLKWRGKERRALKRRSLMTWSRCWPITGTCALIRIIHHSSSFLKHLQCYHYTHWQLWKSQRSSYSQQQCSTKKSHRCRAFYRWASNKWATSSTLTYTKWQIWAHQQSMAM